MNNILYIDINKPVNNSLVYSDTIDTPVQLPSFICGDTLNLDITFVQNNNTCSWNGDITKLISVYIGDSISGSLCFSENIKAYNNNNFTGSISLNTNELSMSIGNSDYIKSIFAVNVLDTIDNSKNTYLYAPVIIYNNLLKSNNIPLNNPSYYTITQSNNIFVRRDEITYWNDLTTASYSNQSLSSSYSEINPIYSSSISSILGTKQDNIITGNIYPITSSWSNNSLTASYISSSNIFDKYIYNLTSSNSISCSNSISACNSISSSYASTASIAKIANALSYEVLTSSYARTAGNAKTADLATISYVAQYINPQYIAFNFSSSLSSQLSNPPVIVDYDYLISPNSDYTVFTTSKNFNDKYVEVYRNGLLLTPDLSTISKYDYYLSGSNYICLNFTASSESLISVKYVLK